MGHSLDYLQDIPMSQWMAQTHQGKTGLTYLCGGKEVVTSLQRGE